MIAAIRARISQKTEDLRIFEIVLLLLLVVIVVPPERLPEAMRTAGKVLRELRLASNTVMRELTSALDDPFNPHNPPYKPPHPTPRNPPPRPAAAAPLPPPVSADPEPQK